MSVYQFTIADKRIGFACLNSAWRATGEPKDVDKGNLVLGERAIDQAIEKLKDSDIKIAVFHHPMVWLQDADQAAVESRLHAEFDILTFGHLHKASPEFRRTLQGEAIALQGSCLYFSRDHYFNGHNIIHIDPDASTVKIELMEYSDERREFVPATRLLSEPMTFPLPSRGGRQVSALSDTLRRIRPNIRRLANEHISLVGGSSALFWNATACLFWYDVDLLNTERMDILKQLIAKHPNVRWILLARIPAGGLTMEPLAAKNFPDFEVFTIRDSTRKAIRALATSWLQLGSDAR